MTKKINHTVAFSTGIIVGVLSWVVITKLFRVTEVYDTPVGGYIAMLLPALLAFYIALTNSLTKALLFLAGVYLATVFYPYFFGNGEQKAWVGIGAALAFSYLFYAFAGALAGWLVRVIYLRFFDKHAKQTAQKIMDKMVEMAEQIPQSAYETYTYTQKAARVGYGNLIFALLFGVIGAVVYVYPSPPLNPIEIPFLQTAIKWLGVCFMLIALYELIRSVRLMADNTAWRIVIDDTDLLYETPKSTDEKSFSCKLDEIEKILIKLDIDPEESISEPTYKIVLKNSQTYPLFGGRNRINKQHLLDALRARGVRVVERY